MSPFSRIVIATKGKELAASPLAALLSFWKELERQVHVRGDVVQTTHEESQAYFFSRPYDARIGAWASLQSEEIPEREWLSERVREFEVKYPNNGKPDCVPLPEHWGGYRVIPHSIEFWQGQRGRKHGSLSVWQGRRRQVVGEATESVIARAQSIIRARDA